jgi:hypothetical protein
MHLDLNQTMSDSGETRSKINLEGSTSTGNTDADFELLDDDNVV